MILSKHYKSVEKAKLKAKSKAQNSYLKHFENVSQNERVIVQIQNFISLEEVVFNEDKLEDLNDCQNNMVIDENPEVEVELNDEQDLVICEEGGQDNDDDHPDTFNDGVQGQEEVFTSKDNVEIGNDNLIIKDAQAHPYAVPESKYQYQEKEEFKNADFDADVFAEEFTPVQPMFEGQEDYIPEDNQRNETEKVLPNQSISSSVALAAVAISIECNNAFTGRRNLSYFKTQLYSFPLSSNVAGVQINGSSLRSTRQLSVAFTKSRFEILRLLFVRLT